MIPHRVAGIPCQVRVLWAEAYRPAYLWGPPERCYPAEGPECEWEITDRRGRHEPWLEKSHRAGGWAMKLSTKIVVLLEDRDLQDEIKSLPNQDIADLFRAMQAVMAMARDVVNSRCHQELQS